MRRRWPAASAGRGLARPIPAVGAQRDVIPTRPGLLTFPLQLGPWEGQLGAVDDETLAILAARRLPARVDYRTPTMRPPGQPLGGLLRFPDPRHGGRTRPQECLPGAGWEFSKPGACAVTRSDAGRRFFPINRAVISKGSERMLMYYWYEQRGRSFTDGVAIWLSILRMRSTKRRSDGALVAPGHADCARRSTRRTPRQRLDRLLRAAYPALEPHVGA